MAVTFSDITKKKDKVTVEECFEVFDNLEAITPDFLVGYRWKGWEFNTGHPLNGALETVGWYGKEFYDENNGQPLLLYSDNEKLDDQLWPIYPPTSFQIPVTGETPDRSKHEAKASQCRLKSILHRGVVTASMFYDENPVNDTFRKVGQDTVMGIMDNKHIPLPYFFVLERAKKL